MTVDDTWGENIGWISFNSTGDVPFGVATSWRTNLAAPAMNTWGIMVALLVLGLGPIWYLRKTNEDSAASRTGNRV